MSLQYDVPVMGTSTKRTHLLEGRMVGVLLFWQHKVDQTQNSVNTLLLIWKNAEVKSGPFSYAGFFYR
jgi:hypothetical protein